MIRDLTNDDLDRVLEINQANVPAVGPATRAHLEHLVAEAAITLVAEVGAEASEDAEQLVGGSETSGFCIVFAAGADYDSINYLWFMEHHPTAMYLDRVAFDERFQGRGLGTEMYAEVDRRIRARHPDATGLTLEVNIDPPNEPSLAFHAKLGFVEVGRQVSKGIEVSLMHRPID